jgi:hypothetical protein
MSHRLSLLNQRIIFPILLASLFLTTSPVMADSGAWAAAIFGGLQGAGQATADIAKREREAENEKEAMRYRYQLEQEREQRRAQEGLRQLQEEKQKAEKIKQEKAANSVVDTTIIKPQTPVTQILLPDGTWRNADAPLGTNPTSNKLATQSNSAADKLRDLKALYKEGVINQKDFETKKQEILKSM